MELRRCVLTENDCYKAGKKLAPRGVMVHSTGADNSNLRRYVQPDDGLLGPNPNGNHWNRPGVDKCVHAFIGKDKTGAVAVYQTLPWDMRGWHAGGSANNTHISFEICEDNLTSRDYFEAVYGAAVELTAYLCERYSLDPLADGVVLCHAEGAERGIASDHGDVVHWWPKFGKSMDEFRADVAREMEGEMTEKDIKKLIDKALSERDEVAVQSAQKVSLWARESWDKAAAKAVFDGTRPGGNLTREQAAVVLDRLGLL